MDKTRGARPQTGKRKPLRAPGHRFAAKERRDYSGTPVLARPGDSFRAGGPDPVQVLLDQLRRNPCAGAITALVEHVERAREDWYNLGAAVRRIMARPLGADEEALVRRLGDNPRPERAGR